MNDSTIAKISKSTDRAHDIQYPMFNMYGWCRLARSVLPLILSVVVLLSCTTTTETNIHLVMGPKTALFPFGVQTASEIRSDIDKANMLIRFSNVIRNIAPDNAALLVEEAMAIVNVTHQQSDISLEQLGNIPYYSSPPLSLSSSIQLANLYIDVAQGLYSIDNEDELNRHIMIEALSQSLRHLKLIEHSAEHSEALLRLFLASIQLNTEGEQIRDTCISIAVSYKILPIKLILLTEMANAIYAEERIIANNLLGHFEVAYIQSSSEDTIDALIANLMALKINTFASEYQVQSEVTLSIDSTALLSTSHNMLTQISNYLANLAPQLFERFYNNPFDSTTKLDILLEYIQSTNSPQQRALYTDRFITEYELQSNAVQYRQLHLILPFVIEYRPNSAPMLITQTAGQNYYQSLRAYTIAAQSYIAQGDVSSAQQYFTLINPRLPIGYPVSDALHYYATYEKIYGRQQLMELILAHRTEPRLASTRLLLLLQSSLSQPFSLEEQQLLTQITR